MEERVRGVCAASEFARRLVLRHTETPRDTERDTPGGVPCLADTGQYAPTRSDTDTETQRDRDTHRHTEAHRGTQTHRDT